MSKNVANYPNSVWDGSSPSRQNVSPGVRFIDRDPDYEDWDQIVAEVIAMQQGGADGAGGAAAGTGVSAVNVAAPVQKTVLTIANLSITMTDAGAAGCHGSQKIFDFPEGNIAILGATTDLAIVAGAGGIVDGAAVVGAVGSTATAVDNATLTTTEANIVPSTVSTLTAGAGATDGQSTAGVTLDGTATPVDAFLNFAVPDADSSASDTLTVNGTVTITWVNLGDN